MVSLVLLKRSIKLAGTCGHEMIQPPNTTAFRSLIDHRRLDARILFFTTEINGISASFDSWLHFLTLFPNSTLDITVDQAESNWPTMRSGPHRGKYFAIYNRVDILSGRRGENADDHKFELLYFWYLMGYYRAQIGQSNICIRQHGAAYRTRSGATPCVKVPHR